MIREWSDTARVAVLRQTSAQQSSDDTLLNLNALLVKFVCSRDAMLVVAGCKGDYSLVAEALTRLVGESVLGSTLYATKPTRSLLSSMMPCPNAWAACEINQEVVDTEGGCDESFGGLPRHGRLAQPPRLGVNYRGLFLPINVTTLSEEVSLKFMAMLTSIAVQSGRLQTLRVESCRKCNVDIALLKALDAARSALEAANHSISSEDAIAKQVGQRAPSLVLDEPTLKIELALLHDLSRDDDRSRPRQMMLDALPSTSQVWSAHVVAAGDLFRFSSRPAQEKARVGHGIGSPTMDERKPDFRMMAQDEFASGVVARCSNFVIATLPGEQKETVFCAVAAAQILNAAVIKAEKETLW